MEKGVPSPTPPRKIKMAKRVSTKPPSGMRDFLPSQLMRRQFVIDTIRSVYARYGFVPLETPAIENIEVLTGKYGEDEKLIYRLLHRGEALTRALEASRTSSFEASSSSPDALSDQALRYDLTVPLARVVAQYPELPRFFKRYQIQPVWRADRPGKGRFREFYQCDVDIVGTTSVLAEAEVCAAGAEVLERLGFRDYVVALNHRELLRALIRHAGIDSEQEGTALVAVDKLDKIGVDGVVGELAGRGVAEAGSRKLLDLIVTTASTDTLATSASEKTLALLREALGHDARAMAALSNLAALLDALEHTPAAGRARITPSLARGLSYYTGAIFEVSVGELGSSIAGGGRYDELIGMFSKQSIPAVGLSLGLERILVVMESLGLYPELPSGADVFVCWRDVNASDVLALAHQWRGAGLRVEIYPEPAKLSRQLQYADSVGARAAVIYGEEERSAGIVALKNLRTGVQTNVAFDGVAEAVAEMDRRRD